MDIVGGNLSITSRAIRGATGSGDNYLIMTGSWDALYCSVQAKDPSQVNWVMQVSPAFYRIHFVVRRKYYVASLHARLDYSTFHNCNDTSRNGSDAARSREVRHLG